jgi:hypothetical protein
MQHASLSPPVFARLANATWSFSQRYWRLVVVAMLLLLHIAVFRGVADPWARALLLAHLGLLLLWQPFLRAEQRVSPIQGLILSCVAFAVMLRLDWWLLAFWVVIIAGLVGGKVYQHHAKWQRRGYLVMLAYLLALLAIAILPEIAPRREITAETRRAAEYALPFFFVLIALFPAEPESAEAAQIIDFFYSVFLMLLLVVVILGSFTFMSVTRSSYLESLTYTVFLTAAAVLLVGLAWNPRSGGGLGVFFERYLFSCRSSAGCRCWPSCCRWRRARSASSTRRWRRSASCPRWPASLGARARGAANAAAARRTWSSSRTASWRSASLRAIGSARRCNGTCTSWASCSASSTSPSCARRSCASRATCRRCTRPVRAPRTTS